MDLEKIVRDYISEVIHLSLATSKNNKPWVCEVHFAYDDRLNLYFRSLSSRRHSQEIAKNPHVAGNIIQPHAVGVYPLGVYFEGTAEMLTDEADLKIPATLLSDRMKAPDDVLADAKLENGHRIYKITIENWYVFGKLDGKSGQKYKLEWNGGNT